MNRELVYAALGATNEAILRTTAQDELFQRVCDAAVQVGMRVAITLLPQQDGWLECVAAAGLEAGSPLPNLRISVNSDSDRGHGLAGTAFRTAKSCVSNDYQNDPRLQPWLREGRTDRIGAAAAVPLLQDGASIGVFLFFVETAHSFTDDIVALLERMLENVSFALQGFEREKQRKQMERANRRLTDMFAALSATNTAILRAQNTTQMFQTVCESVAKGGKSLGAAAILLSQPDSHWLKLVAAAGQGMETISRMKASIDPDNPYGQGLAGPAFREQKLMITYNLLADSRTSNQADHKRSPYGGAAAPLIVAGRSVGIIFFFFGRTSGTGDEGIQQLMRDIAENVSFGIEGFQREEQKDRYVRMFAALSATNEAIMRANNREELFRMLCENTAGGGKFTSTSVLLASPDQEHFEVGGTAGPNSGLIRSQRFAIKDDLSEAGGIVGSAFRTAKPCIENNFESRVPRQSEHVIPHAAAALPLFSRGQTIGVLLIMAGEKDAFTSDFTELLKRLSENVSLAVSNFDSRDEKIEAERRIQYLATHDALTGLPNRVMFMQLLEQSIAVARRERRKCGVLFIDLDRFKIINDSLGHAAGDQLLIEAASRLRSSVRESDVVARLGGDEFVAILNGVNDAGQVEVVARKILANLIASMDVAGHECRTTASIGVAIYPDHGEDGHMLTKNADIAMYAAKGDGKNDFRFYSPEIRSQSIERLVLETNLRRALELNQFTLQYQPKLNVRTGAVSGVEALLRWNHPDLGNLPPVKFIPLAEETGLIVPIGRWVLKTACEQAIAWQKQGLPPFSIAVNLSPRQFQDENLLHDIDEVLQQTGLEPALLELEITESMVMQNVQRAIKLLAALHARGVRLAIDDFGTGYSSMSMMKQFPIDTIKIDRSFVRDLDNNPEDRAITTAIISMGKALGLTIVAEGVETEGQSAFLKAGSCDELQGFLFSSPVSAAEIAALIAPSVDSPALQPRGEKRHARAKV